MANINWQTRILNSDGTAFSVSNNGANASVRLRDSDASGADSGAYGTFAEVGNGIWRIAISEEDSGYFRVETTTDGSTWTAVTGMSPVYIILEAFLALDGGTMTGNIAMGDNSVTGVDTITFTDTAGTIAGIANGNLLDKSAAETVSGNWDFTGNFSLNGAQVTASAAEINLVDGITTTYHLATLEGGGYVSGRAQVSSNLVMTNANMGYLDVTTAGGAIQITLPAIGSGANEAPGGSIVTITLTTAGNNLTIIDNAADGGFSLANADDGQATGSTITMSTAKDIVCLMSSGCTGGYWLILGGFGVDLS